MGQSSSSPRISNPQSPTRPLQSLNEPPLVWITPEMMNSINGLNPILPRSAFPVPPIGAPPAQVETATVLRNPVNLRKDSVRIIEDSAHPSRLYIEFQFDASMPCSISAFFVGMEAPPANPNLVTNSITDRIMTRLPQSGLRHLFPAGMRQKFSQALPHYRPVEWTLQRPRDGSHPRDCLDISQYSLEELLHVGKREEPGNQPSFNVQRKKWTKEEVRGGTSPSLSYIGCSLSGPSGVEIPSGMFPIIIVITALPEDGADEPIVQPQMQASYIALDLNPFPTQPPSPAYPDDAQCQSLTISTTWTPHVVLQQVQIGRNVWLLKELFGTAEESSSNSHASNGASGSNASDQDLGGGFSDGRENYQGGNPGTQNNECVICLTDDRTTAILPCRHVCLCSACAEQLRYQSNSCPICRGPVQSFLKISYNSTQV